MLCMSESLCPGIGADCPGFGVSHNQIVRRSRGLFFGRIEGNVP